MWLTIEFSFWGPWFYNKGLISVGVFIYWEEYYAHFTHSQGWWYLGSPIFKGGFQIPIGPPSIDSCTTGLRLRGRGLCRHQHGAKVLCQRGSNVEGMWPGTQGPQQSGCMLGFWTDFKCGGGHCKLYSGKYWSDGLDKKSMQEMEILFFLLFNTGLSFSISYFLIALGCTRILSESPDTFSKETEHFQCFNVSITKMVSTLSMIIIFFLFHVPRGSGHPSPCHLFDNPYVNWWGIPFRRVVGGIPHQLTYGLCFLGLGPYI